MLGEIIEIKYKKIDGTTISTESAFLKEDFGIEGDTHGGGFGRNISIMKLSTKESIKKIDGLCTKRFKESLLIKSNYSFNEGDIITIGDTILKISSAGKKCFNECKLFQIDFKCPMHEIFYADVVKSGKIQIGDIIKMQE